MSALERYCDINKLKVNIEKSKIVIFKKGRDRASKDSFFYAGERIEVVETFKYLGILFSKSGVFNLTSKDMISRATVAISATKNVLVGSNLSPWVCKIKILESCICSVLLYGSEFWALRYTDQIEVVQSKLLKSLFFWQRNTAGYMVRIESDRLKLEYFVFKRALNWLVKLLDMRSDRLPKICYNKLLLMDNSTNNIQKYNWVSQIKKYFFELGYGWLWHQQDMCTINKFKNNILNDLKQRLINRDLERTINSTYSSLYKLLIRNKNFNSYVKLNVSFELIRIISQVRMASDNVCVLYVKGDRHQINSQEICSVCNYENENLAHIFIDCPGYASIRNKYLSKCRPLTAENILNIKHKSHLLDVYNFITACLKLRKSILQT